MGQQIIFEAAAHLFAFLLELFVYIYKLLTKGAFFCKSVMSFLSFNVQLDCFFKKKKGGGGREKTHPIILQ